jgi:uncharacterized protein YozE (UPF0346 family)
MSIANKCLLATLNISQWTGRKLDKKATGTVEATHATTGKVGNYTKKLLPGAAELAEVSRLAGAIRTFFYTQSLPWHTDGSRIISNANYLEFTAKFRAHKSEFDHSVSEFLTAYPMLRAQAKAKLGDLFNETEYPTVSGLAQRFACDVSFMPVPDIGDFRVEILDSEKRAFLDSMATVERNAMRDCWSRLHDVTSKAAAKLSDPTAIFRDSLLENVLEMCALLPRLNITDDSDLELMRRKVESAVSKLSADTCRENPHVRASAATDLDSITRAMSAFMGAA